MRNFSGVGGMRWERNKGRDLDLSGRIKLKYLSKIFQIYFPLIAHHNIKHDHNLHSLFHPIQGKN